MKISDEELLKRTWRNQLKVLCLGVLHHYIGGTFGLVDNTGDDIYFVNASSEHSAGIHNVTTIICRQQLRKRLVKLASSGEITLPYGKRQLTFYVNSDNVKKRSLQLGSSGKSKGPRKELKMEYVCQCP